MGTMGDQQGEVMSRGGIRSPSTAPCREENRGLAEACQALRGRTSVSHLRVWRSLRSFSPYLKRRRKEGKGGSQTKG